MRARHVALLATLLLALSSFPAHAVGLFKFTGTVRDAAGTALSGVTVSDGPQSTTTTASGTYSLDEVSTGSYTLTASRSDTLTSTKTVNVNVPVDQTVNFTLTYKLTTSIDQPNITTASGAGTATLSINSWAPNPTVASCVTVTDSRTGSTTNATLSTSGSPSVWTWTLSLPQGTTEDDYTLTARAVACGTSTVLSATATKTYVVDNTAPLVREATPFDAGNTVFNSQPMLVRVWDAGGSGLDPLSIGFTLTDTTTGQVQTFSGAAVTYSSATGWAKTSGS